MNYTNLKLLSNFITSNISIIYIYNGCTLVSGNVFLIVGLAITGSHYRLPIISQNIIQLKKWYRVYVCNGRVECLNYSFFVLQALSFLVLDVVFFKWCVICYLVQFFICESAAAVDIIQRRMIFARPIGLTRSKTFNHWS